MKRFFKRCLYGLVASTVLVNSARAQSDSEAGAVRISDQPAPQQPLTPVPDSYYNYGGPVDLPPGGGTFGYTNVDRVFEPRFFVDTRGGNLYGYNEGYTNVGGLMPFFIEDDVSLIFLEARGMMTNDGKGGANVGLGVRKYVEDFDRIFGASIWYDYDNGHLAAHDQFGLSVESIGRYFDLRANGYIPIGKDDQNVGTFINPDSGFYSGNNIYVSRTTLMETIYTGFDIEAGGPMPILGRYGMSGYVGFYFFRAAGDSGFAGVSGRLTHQLNEDLSLNVQMTDDSEFGTNAQIQVIATLPDGMPSRWLRQLGRVDRLVAPVVRNYRATTVTSSSQQSELAINPDDMQPYFIVHVDPNGTVGASTGNGTIENPFNLLADADLFNQANFPDVDIIRVRPRGDGTSANLDSGISLFSNQRLLGSTTPHTLATQFGTEFNLPGQETGALPILTNALGGDVVTLTDGSVNIEVSGFDIQGSVTGNGIYGSNNQQVYINQNRVSNGLNGVLLENLTGTGAAASIIDSNEFASNVGDQPTIPNSGDGLRIENDSGVLDVSITNNQATGNAGDGMEVNTSGTAVATVYLANNNIDEETGEGIAGANQENGFNAVASDTSTLNLIVEDNAFFGNTGAGFAVLREDDAIVNVVLEGNQFGGGANGAGVDIIFDGNAAPVNTFFSADNVYDNSASDGLSIAGRGDSRTYFQSDRDTFTNNAGNGLRIAVEESDDPNIVDTPELVAVVNNITATGNENGLALLSTDQGVLTVLVDSPLDPDFTGTGSTFSQNTNGIQATSSKRGELSFTLLDAVVDGNTQDGLNILRSDASLAEVFVDNSTFNGNTRDGLRFNFRGSSPNDPNQPDTTNPNLLVVTNSTFNGVGGVQQIGMNLIGQDDAALLADVTLSTFNQNSENGVRVHTDDSSTFGNPITGGRSVFDGITVSQNLGDGMQFIAGDSVGVASKQYVAIVANAGNSLISNNGGNGIVANAAFPRGTSSPALGDDIPGSGEAFMDLLVSGDTDGAGPLNQTRITANALNGISSITNDTAIVRVGDGLGTGVIGSHNVLIDGNTQDGIYMRVQFTGEGTIDVRGVDDMNRATIARNGGDGIELSVSDPTNGGLFDATGASGLLLMNFAEIGGQTIADQNGDHGVNINSDGPNTVQTASSNVSADVRNSNIRYNAKDGVHIDLEGRMLGNNFNFDGNLISENGWTGFYFQQNAGEQFRVGDDGVLYNHVLVRGLLAQPTTPPTRFNPDDVMSLTDSAFGPTSGIANNGEAFGRSGYMNLTTSLQSNLVMTNNIIQHNGIAAGIDDTMGDGIFLRVSTNSLLRADIGGADDGVGGNTFQGNRLADLRTEAFSAYRSDDGVIMATLKPVSTAAGSPTLDRIFLDDTAQLDLRFFDNVGNTVNPQTYATTAIPMPRSDLRGDPAEYRGAFYAINDNGGDGGLLGNSPIRDVSLFQVANAGGNLNSSNFFDTPIDAATPPPQNLINSFLSRGFFVRNTDTWPGTNFPVPYSIQPGNPYSP